MKNFINLNNICNIIWRYGVNCIDEMFYIYFFFIIAFLISSFLLFFNLILVHKLFRYSNYLDKESPYECGYEPFIDTRGKFSVNFYIISILFLIFDVEIILLYPWALSLSLTQFFGFFSGSFFIIILVLVLLFEWSSQSFDF